MARAADRAWVAALLAVGFVLVGYGCGESFVSGGTGGGSGTATSSSGSAGGGGGVISSANGGGTGGSGVGTTGAGGGQGGQGGLGGGGGGSSCLSCADAFAATPPVTTKLCSGEEAKLLALHDCICKILGTTACSDCADYCADIAAPSDECLTCADNDGACDSVGKDCNASPF